MMHPKQKKLALSILSGINSEYIKATIERVINDGKLGALLFERLSSIPYATKLNPIYEEFSGQIDARVNRTEVFIGSAWVTIPLPGKTVIANMYLKDAALAPIQKQVDELLRAPRQAVIDTDEIRRRVEYLCDCIRVPKQLLLVCPYIGRRLLPNGVTHKGNTNLRLDEIVPESDDFKAACMRMRMYE
jgi:hypothetical protein